MTCIKPPPPAGLAATRPVALSPARRHAAAWAKASVLRAALIGVLILGPTAHAQTGPQPRLQTTPLTAGMHIIQAELAITPEQQATGMMFRREMGTHEGMLFVNEAPAVRCFWMRNTLIPLSIAFIADDGTIVNIAEMDALSERSHCAAQPVRFALEMNSGWFAKRGIKAGARLQGKPFRP